MRDQPRLHIDPEQTTLRSGAVLAMQEAHSHYLGTVLRKSAGDAVRLFNIRDGEWEARIESLQKGRRGSFIIVSLVRPPAPETGPLLLFAPVKRDATDLVVRMATELGATGLWPVLTERTNTARINIDRLRAIATEASEQCERLGVPTVCEPQRLATVLSEWQHDRTLCVAIERISGSSAPSRPAGITPPRPAGDALLIGPEGGFTALELDVLHAHPFVTAISLGSRILRAETAAVAGLSCLQAAREQWGAGVRERGVA